MPVTLAVARKAVSTISAVMNVRILRLTATSH